MAQWHLISDALQPELIWQVRVAAFVITFLCGATMAMVLAPPVDAPVLRVCGFLIATASGMIRTVPLVGWSLAFVTVGMMGWAGVGAWPPLRKNITLGWLIGLVGIGGLLSLADVGKWDALLIVSIDSLASVFAMSMLISLSRPSQAQVRPAEMQSRKAKRSADQSVDHDLSSGSERNNVFISHNRP